MIIYSNQEYIKEWASKNLFSMDFGNSVAIADVKNNGIVGAVVYNNYRQSPSGEPISIELNVTIIDKTCCTRHNLRQLFAYPFIQLGVKRVGATVAKRNKHVRQLLKRLGFKYEGVMRKAWHFGEDCAVYSMLKQECKWIKYVS